MLTIFKCKIIADFWSVVEGCLYVRVNILLHVFTVRECSQALSAVAATNEDIVLSVTLVKPEICASDLLQ